MRKKQGKIALLASALLFSNLSFSDMAVIVHPENTSTFNEDIIKKIFLGKLTKFTNGLIAIPMNASEDMPTYDAFNDKMTGKSRTQINAYWARLVFTGKGDMPKVLSSDIDIVSTVSVNPGAISYVDSSSVTDKVKVIANF
ncbi:MAG: ABC-type phosphate transport system substrate-binding protein [Oleispira sp.]|jgi:ABC-type phosphate transport system substrate-binding protein